MKGRAVGIRFSYQTGTLSEGIRPRMHCRIQSICCGTCGVRAMVPRKSHEFRGTAGSESHTEADAIDETSIIVIVIKENLIFQLSKSKSCRIEEKFQTSFRTRDKLLVHIIAIKKTDSTAQKRYEPSGSEMIIDTKPGRTTKIVFAGNIRIGEILTYASLQAVCEKLTEAE